MIDDKLMTDLDDMEKAALAIKDILGRQYYHPDFGTTRTRPIISMMISGAQYLADNLVVLRRMYQEKASKQGA